MSLASRWTARMLPVVLAGIAAVSCGGTAPPEGERSAARPLRIGLHAEPPMLDPHLQSESVANSVLSNLFEGLTSFDGEMRLGPALAERWESPDDLTWVLHLRRGVTFHDGRPLTPRDVLFSLERARDHPESRVSSFLVAVASWRALDGASVEIRTLRPYPILLNKLALVAIVPDGSPAPIVDPVGTGRYRLVRRAAAGLELAAYERHWAGRALHDRVTFTFVPDGGRRAAGLLDGTFDLITEVGPHEAREVARSNAAELRGRDSLTVNYLQLPGDHPPFSDPRVREAIHLAVDREELVREMAGGMGSPVAQMVGPNVFGFVPGLTNPGRDPERARRLLTEVGYPGGLDVVLDYREGRNLDPLLRQLSGAGIRVQARARPWAELYRELQSGQLLFYFGGWSCTSGDASDLFDGKVHTRNPQTGYGSQQGRAVSTPLLDRLIEVAGSATEMGDRRRMLEQAMRELMAHRTLLPLYVPRTEFGVSRELEFTPRLDGQVRASEIRWRAKP